MTATDRLVFDLNHSMQRGKLRGLQLAALILECCQTLPQIDLSDDYDFGVLELAIEVAEELMGEADELAGKLEGRESAFRSVARLVYGLAKAAAPSRRLQRLVIDVTERIFEMPRIGMKIRWPDGGKDEFYNAAVWGSAADMERMLDEFCDD